MSGTFVRCSNPDNLAIAKMAQALSTMMLEVATDESINMGAWEVCFAACLAMKAQSEMWSQMLGCTRDEVLQALREAFDLAMKQDIIAKHFASKEEAMAWQREQEATRAVVPVADYPSGTRH